MMRAVSISIAMCLCGNISQIIDVCLNISRICFVEIIAIIANWTGKEPDIWTVMMWISAEMFALRWFGMDSYFQMLFFIDIKWSVQWKQDQNVLMYKNFSRCNIFTYIYIYAMYTLYMGHLLTFSLFYRIYHIMCNTLDFTHMNTICILVFHCEHKTQYHVIFLITNTKGSVLKCFF